MLEFAAKSQCTLSCDDDVGQTTRTQESVGKFWKAGLTSELARGSPVVQ